MNKRLIVWGICGLLSMFFLLHAIGCMWEDGCRSSDDEWGRMWCYVIAAIAGLLLPWLISVRAVWSTRLGLGLGLLASIAMVGVVCGDFDDPLYDFPIQTTGITVICKLWVAAGAFLLAALLPALRRNLRCATATELKWLRKVGRLLLVLAVGFALYVMLLLGALMVGIYETRFLPLLLAYTAVFSSFVLYIWPIAEFLPLGVWRRVCYRILLWGLLPGLLAASPSYFIGMPRSGFPGDELISVRLLSTLVPLVLAFILGAYFRRRIAEETSK